MITLFGATGYTGSLIAANLAKDCIPFRIAGRSEEKLRRLSNFLANKPPWIIADATKPSSLTALFHDSNVIINCAGPYTDLGERMIAQAAMSGCRYLDLTNELGFYYKGVGYQEMARRTGAVIVPACAFEVALADCAAAVIARNYNQPEQPFDDIDVIYELGIQKASSGTRRSALRSLATSWISYRDGQWGGEIPGSVGKNFPLHGKDVHALSIPSCESITIPAHVNATQVNIWLAVTRSQQFWGPIFLPMLARLSRSIFRGLILKLGGRGELSPDNKPGTEPHEGNLFSIIIRMHRATEVHWMKISGHDPYFVTAKIAAYAARQLSNMTGDIKGFLSPSQAFDPQEFLTIACQSWYINITEGKTNVNE